MQGKATHIRLYVEQPLGQAQSLVLDRAQAHYLFAVMRLVVGDRLFVFNGRDGEWCAEVTSAGKRQGILTAQSQTRQQQDPPDLWLLFAPIKKQRTDFIVEKATELGASRIAPVLTDHTNAERVKIERLQAHAVEAAEQCGGTYVPTVAPVAKLKDVLEKWNDERQIYFCNEDSTDKRSMFCAGKTGNAAAILIGPEGGFSQVERGVLNTAPFVTPISLGPRILRADTAAVAALTLWQSTNGDWT